MIKTEKKYFKDNRKYFNFINKQKDKIRVIVVKPTKTSIKVEYMKLALEGSD